jgi:glyceraldehyde-3-phosphate dehydrogenase/erythrose-4-phosphate dehydrogenase
MKLLCIVTLTACVALPAERKVKLEELPPAVQTAVKEQTKNATLVDLSAEKEKGKTVYEVETKIDAKSRTLLLDETGAVIETEEEVDMDAVPAPAKAAIQKHATGGTISKIEKVSAGVDTSYEATIRMKAGKIREYAVNADGTQHRED